MNRSCENGVIADRNGTLPRRAQYADNICEVALSEGSRSAPIGTPLEVLNSVLNQSVAGDQHGSRRRCRNTIRDQQCRQQDLGAAPQLDPAESAEDIRPQRTGMAEITTTFSRPVSRPTRRTFSGGRELALLVSSVIGTPRRAESGNGRQCENRIGSGGFDSRLLVAPPRMNSRHRACP